MKKILFVCCLVLSNLAFSQIDSNALKVGEVAPNITGVDQFGNTINTDAILKDHKVLLLFYRGNWCPYCKKHLKALNENLEALTKKGYYVIVVTPEKVERVKETSDMLQAKFSILHDKNNKIMKDYKVAFDVNKQNVTSYYEFTLKKINQYNEPENKVLPVPATYVINQQGVISFVHYDPDYKKRADFETILKLK
jgi:peroxiredoxin